MSKAMNGGVNPVGNGPGDTNPLLETLRDGDVVVVDRTHTKYYRMKRPGVIERFTYTLGRPTGGNPELIDPLWFVCDMAKAMASYRSTVDITTGEELDRRIHNHRVELAFYGLNVTDRRIKRGAWP